MYFVSVDRWDNTSSHIFMDRYKEMVVFDLDDAKYETNGTEKIEYKN